MSRSFTSAAKRRAPIEFDIDGEQFRAYPVLPADVLGEVSNLAANDDQVARVRGFLDLIDSLLYPDDAARFRARMGAGAEAPLGIEDVAEIVTWLLPQVTGRPTVGASPSPSGSTADDTSSTGGALPEAPTSSD